MWLLRFHRIETRDYNRVDRFFRDIQFIPRKFSPMLLMKWLLLSVFQKKSWRQISRELNISHIPLYNFVMEVRDTPEAEAILRYFIERWIILFIADEKNITETYLQSNLILENSLAEFHRRKV